MRTFSPSSFHICKLIFYTSYIPIEIQTCTHLATFGLGCPLTQVSETCKASYFHIRALRHIRSSLTTEACKTVAAAIVGSRLDYCNSLLAGTSVSNLARLQLVQNTLAQVVAQKPRFCHITPVLADLHWLPIRHRISFKIASIAFKVLHFQQPSYLAALVPRYVPTRSLRSSSSLSICIPSLKTAMARSKSFSSVASDTWNRLPCHLSSISALPTFRKRLKHHLFSLLSPVFPLHPLTSRFVMSSRGVGRLKKVGGQDFMICMFLWCHQISIPAHHG